MIYRIKDLVSRRYLRGTDDSESLKGARSLIEKAVKEGKITAVQGPPGTGKTTIFYHVIRSVLDGIPPGSPITYIAPTNQLVADMVARVADIYKEAGIFPDFTNQVRVYGSQFDYVGYESLLNRPDNNTKIIITTEYQRIFGKLKSFDLFIDEASKSRISQSFIPLTPSLLGREQIEGKIFSISVIGDPQQAIAIENEYMGQEKDKLLLNAILKGSLSDSAKQEVEKDPNLFLSKCVEELDGKMFKFLDLTFRMPSPSERGISNGFYDGKLTAKSKSEERTKEVWDEDAKANVSKLSTENDEFKKIAGEIGSLLSSGRSMLYLKSPVEGFRNDLYESGLLYDKRRGHYGVIAATALAVITRRSTLVCTTYTDQRIQMQLEYQQNYAAVVKGFELNPSLIRFGTVHKNIGSESENVVAILGKEYSGKEDSKTMYFTEPEVLNVQLTRHRRFLAIVGDLGRLATQSSKMNRDERTTKYSPLKTTADVILEQAGFERKGERFIRRRSSGDCGYIDAL